MIPEQKAAERAKQPETSTVRELMDEVERLKAERDHWMKVARRAGACMTCGGPSGAPEPYGCSDCLNTGWSGEYQNEVSTLTARNAELMDEVERLKAINAILMGDDEDKPRYTTKRLRHEIAQATATLTARNTAMVDEAKAIQLAWDKLPKGHNSVSDTQKWLIEFSEVIKPLILRSREQA